MKIATISSLFIGSVWSYYKASLSNSFIYDEFGRVSIFHGENFVQVSLKQKNNRKKLLSSLILFSSSFLLFFFTTSLIFLFYLFVYFV